ncbi:MULTISPECIES: hypothetical protein [unclassified Legionella]|uniref:hypothetical protein n=1 Tax=unclassified Legionella TaxID=2622702 RepID=UPI001E3A1B00|nr:hypothetical protein [Legionella sp. 31fI33]MCC5014840.1 hypothetical protein [Legionella sp. 31fI33]
MKFVIEKVELIRGEKPTVMISWSSGTTDFYPWHSYPALPDLTGFKPWYYCNTPGLTLFRAPATTPLSEIRMHNIRHYQRDPQQAPIFDLAQRLEKAADEIEDLSRQHCLYPVKQKQVVTTKAPVAIAKSAVAGKIPATEHTTEDNQDESTPSFPALT